MYYVKVFTNSIMESKNSFKDIADACRCFNQKRNALHHVRLHNDNDGLIMESKAGVVFFPRNVADDYAEMSKDRLLDLLLQALEYLSVPESSYGMTNQLSHTLMNRFAITTEEQRYLVRCNESGAVPRQRA